MDRYRLNALLIGFVIIESTQDPTGDPASVEDRAQRREIPP
ncbi:MAG: hypothetical protein AAFP04_02375 [Myxococcota bacterium]